MNKQHNKFSLSEIWLDYRAEIVFGLILVAVVMVSTRLSQFIPDNIFDNVLSPAFNIATITIALSGAWIIFRHAGGTRMHRLWGYALLTWMICDSVYFISYLLAPMQVMNMGAKRLTDYELLIGNLLGWVMILYPTETLRPGWLNAKTILWQLVPLFVLAALDYVLPVSLWPLLALYPYVWLVLVLSHIRAYRQWCENNFSSMDNIDTQWIVRYCIMLFIMGANFFYMCVTKGHARGFTQQWFVVLVLAYSTEQILFRRNPWIDQSDNNEQPDENQPATVQVPEAEDASLAETVLPDKNIQLLEQWMTTQKPYLNPDLKLIDLRAVVPVNRTYLSQLINTTYGCSFYQFVNRYRIHEAQRLMKAHPDMKFNRVASLSGFSSYTVFTRIFLRETGVTPADWLTQSSTDTPEGDFVG